MAKCRLPEDNSTQALETRSPMIIVQGGAYSQMLGDLTQEYKEVAKQSAKKGYKILMDGQTAVEAVEAAVNVFENSPCFNCGHGSYLNCEGEVECDAMIMEGHTLNSGAVIGGRNFRNPVSLSKLIMTDSPHCALSASGALEFARDKGFRICEDPGELKSEYALKIGHSGYQKYRRHHYMGTPLQEQEREQEREQEQEADFDINYERYIEEMKGTPPAFDTVSAVAMDTNGHLACATSTGGIAGKLKGRVGDAPMIGCGAYANKTGAATVTGFGESIMKLTLGREVVYNMENGQTAQEAAVSALEKLKDYEDDRGGVIAIDKKGNIGMFFTTEKMVWASMVDNTLQFGFEKDEVKPERSLSDQ